MPGRLLLLSSGVFHFLCPADTSGSAPVGSPRRYRATCSRAEHRQHYPISQRADQTWWTGGAHGHALPVGALSGSTAAAFACRQCSSVRCAHCSPLLNVADLSTSSLVDEQSAALNRRQHGSNTYRCDPGSSLGRAESPSSQVSMVELPHLGPHRAGAGRRRAVRQQRQQADSWGRVSSSRNERCACCLHVLESPVALTARGPSTAPGPSLVRVSSSGVVVGEHKSRCVYLPQLRDRSVVLTCSCVFRM